MNNVMENTFMMNFPLLVFEQKNIMKGYDIYYKLLMMRTFQIIKKDYFKIDNTFVTEWEINGTRN